MGDRMKKMIGVCLLFVLIAAGALWIDHQIGRDQNEITQDSEKVEETEVNTASAERVMVSETAKYQAADSEGKVVILWTGSGNVFCETAISYKKLPDEIKKRWRTGFIFRMKWNCMNSLRIILPRKFECFSQICYNVVRISGSQNICEP